MEDTMISVIVPIYNTEKYLEECLISLTEQTVPFYEIILVNDGASDKCREICNRYCAKNENMLIVNQPNQGLAVARNNGMKVATGKYVVFVDSDDLVAKEMNEILIRRFSEDLDVLYYSAKIKNEVGKKVLNNSYLREPTICNCVMTGEDFFEKTYPNNCIVSACCAMYRKSFLDSNKIAFPQGVYYEDNPFYFNVVLKAKKVECITDKLYIRRYRSNSITMSEMNIKKCSDKLTVQMLIWNILKSNNIDYNKNRIFKEYILRQGINAVEYSFLHKELRQKREEFLECFMDSWKSLFDLNSISWNELCAIMKYGQWQGEYKIEGPHAKFFHEIRVLFLTQLKERLNKLPFQEKGLVAVYGIGKGAEALIRLYELLIGKVQSEICYIVSDRTDAAPINIRIYTCEEIPDKVERIIISSRIYQQEMLDNLKRNGIPAKKAVLLYQESDWFDLAFIGGMELEE